MTADLSHLNLIIYASPEYAFLILAIKENWVQFSKCLYFLIKYFLCAKTNNTPSSAIETEKKKSDEMLSSGDQHKGLSRDQVPILTTFFCSVRSILINVLYL